MRTLTITLLLAAAILLPAFGAWAQDATPPEEQPKKPKKQNEAIERRRRQVANIDLRVRQAQLYLRKNESDKAIEILEELYKTHPHDSRVVRGLP